MDRYEKAALLDFVASVVWPTRTVRLVTTPGGETEFDVIGTWVTATDIPMAWVNGNRVTGSITWVSPTRVALPSSAAVGSQVIIFVSPGSGSGYLPRNTGGTVAMLNDLLMGPGPGGLYRIRHLGAAVEGDDAVRKDQVLALIAQQLGGNYVAKAGDQMGGPLLLANDDPTKGTAAVRRALVALLDATQAFTGKIRAPSTVDADHGQTLTTKDWVEAYVQEQLANTQAPNHEAVFSVAGSGYTFVVGTDCAPTVRKLWVYAKGGKGGNGGAGFSATGGVGGLGGTIAGSFRVIDDAVLSIVVGGNGANSSNPGFDGGKWPAPGAGGGGGTRVSTSTSSITAGGGGGGGGGKDTSNSKSGGNGGNGGGGGEPGQGVYNAGGAVPGNTITEAGGIGGTGGRNGAVNGQPGGVGTGAATADVNTDDNFPFQSITDPNAVSGSGLVIIKWYEA
jgi:hypothetical protein